MTNTRAKLLALGLPLALLAGAALSLPDTRPKPAAPTPVFAYRAWTRVNPVPIQIAAPLAALCAPPRFPNPHQGDAGTKYGTVWVNSVGQKAMLTKKAPLFPVGTIIVKEKLSGPTSSTPELLTAMRKRGAGFNPKGGHWEYLVLNGTGTQIQTRGALQTCQSCHAAQSADDYVFRTYLSQNAVRKFR